MKKIQKRITGRNSLNLILYTFLVFGLLSFISCGGKEEVAEEPGQTEAAPEQAKVEELQNELANKDAEIAKLKEENAALLSRLPESYEVQDGDTHWKIAFDYLTKQGISEDEARSILKDSSLFDPLVTGFNVSNSYDREYGSFVVQGNANVSPGKVMRVEATRRKADKVRLKNKLTWAEIRVLRKNSELAYKIKGLERDKIVLDAQLASIKQRALAIQGQNEDFESMLNSVYYFADTRANLRATGKTSLGKFSSEDFQNRIDLRRNNVIELNAGDFNIPTIKKVEIIPKTEENRDYRIEVLGGGQVVKVYLLNTDKFRMARILIILR